MKSYKKYSVIVIGGGHAGVEAACSAARIGVDVALITHKINKISIQPKTQNNPPKFQ